MNGISIELVEGSTAVNGDPRFIKFSWTSALSGIGSIAAFEMMAPSGCCHCGDLVSYAITHPVIDMEFIVTYVCDKCWITMYGATSPANCQTYKITPKIITQASKNIHRPNFYGGGTFGTLEPLVTLTAMDNASISIKTVSDALDELW